MSLRGQSWVDRLWYGQSPLALVLMPLSWLFAAAVKLRRGLYAGGTLRSISIGVPVVVVGNITVGGTGKTPVTIAVVEALADRGFRPGVVSRGYRGNVGPSPVRVTADSEPAIVGDEPVLIARRSGCPVAVHPDRVAAARLLVEEGVDVVVSDDGLQHYRLARDVEIAIIDGSRWLGNGRLLPAGPLREPAERLNEVDRVLINGESARTLSVGIATTGFILEPGRALSLDGSRQRELASFAGTTVHAVAAIGNPERFFDMLRSIGVDVVAHPFPDHHAFDAADLDFDDALDVVMTEKDAVKCRGHASAGCWYVPVTLTTSDPGWLEDIISRIGTPSVMQREPGGD